MWTQLDLECDLKINLELNLELELDLELYLVITKIQFTTYLFNLPACLSCLLNFGILPKFHQLWYYLISLMPVIGNITPYWTLSSADVWIIAISCTINPSAFLLFSSMSLKPEIHKYRVFNCINFNLLVLIQFEVITGYSHLMGLTQQHGLFSHKLPL